jgi:ribosome-binding ATPase YchF (GTP1/OBG family)
MPGPEYVPTGPYFLKSGNRIGKSLEELMFEDYSKLLAMRSQITVAKNEMQMHLLWLFERGEDRIAGQICEYCCKEKITHFAYSYAEKKYYKGCNSITCRGALLSKAKRYPLKFSSIACFAWGSRPYVSAFFKSVFFPGCEDPTAQQLFEFFSAPLEAGRP